MRLRYHPSLPTEFKPNATIDATPSREPSRLVFPRQALDQARGHRTAMSHSSERASRRRGRDIVASINAELDFMTQSMATLAEDVANFKFPVADDSYEPPSAA